jgi:hypothetical protein
MQPARTGGDACNGMAYFGYSANVRIADHEQMGVPATLTLS